MNRRIIFGIAFAVFAVLILILTLTGLIVPIVIVPILLVWSIIASFISILPQPVLWAMVLYMVVMIMLRSLPIKFGKAEIAPPGETAREGRVTRLTRWFQNANEGEYFRKRLLREFVGITLATLEYDEVNEARIAELLRGDKLGLPDHIRQYLLGALRESDFSPSRKGRKLTLPAFFASSRAKTAYNTPEVIELIELLENELEIRHHGD